MENDNNAISVNEIMRAPRSSLRKPPPLKVNGKLISKQLDDFLSFIAMCEKQAKESQAMCEFCEAAEQDIDHAVEFMDFDKPEFDKLGFKMTKIKHRVRNIRRGHKNLRDVSLIVSRWKASNMTAIINLQHALSEAIEMEDKRSGSIYKPRTNILDLPIFNNAFKSNPTKKAQEGVRQEDSFETESMARIAADILSNEIELDSDEEFDENIQLVDTEEEVDETDTTTENPEEEASESITESTSVIEPDIDSVPKTELNNMIRDSIYYAPHKKPNQRHARNKSKKGKKKH